MFIISSYSLNHLSLKLIYICLFIYLWQYQNVHSYERIYLSPGDTGTDAIQRTTTAVTLVSGGVKENVLPPSAQVLGVRGR